MPWVGKPTRKASELWLLCGLGDGGRIFTTSKDIAKERLQGFKDKESMTRSGLCRECKRRGQKIIAMLLQDNSLYRPTQLSMHTD